MKFFSGDLVKLKPINQNVNSGSAARHMIPNSKGIYLTHVRIEEDNIHSVLTEFVSLDVDLYALILREEYDLDNEFYGEYQILIADKVYFCSHYYFESNIEL